MPTREVEASGTGHNPNSETQRGCNVAQNQETGTITYNSQMGTVSDRSCRYYRGQLLNQTSLSVRPQFRSTRRNICGRVCCPVVLLGRGPTGEVDEEQLHHVEGPHNHKQATENPPRFRVMTSIGLKYIWIDALCTIQDDDTDKQLEIERMSSYYGANTVTLRATSPSTCEGGFLGTRPDMHYEAGPFQLPFETRDGIGSILLCREAEPLEPTTNAPGPYKRLYCPDASWSSLLSSFTGIVRL
jgi:hypothetical protein